MSQVSRLICKVGAKNVQTRFGTQVRSFLFSQKLLTGSKYMTVLKEPTQNSSDFKTAENTLQLGAYVPLVSAIPIYLLSPYSVLSLVFKKKKKKKVNFLTLNF